MGTAPTPIFGAKERESVLRMLPNYENIYMYYDLHLYASTIKFFSVSETLQQQSIMILHLHSIVLFFISSVIKFSIHLSMLHQCLVKQLTELGMMPNHDPGRPHAHH